MIMGLLDKMKESATSLGGQAMSAASALGEKAKDTAGNMMASYQEKKEADAAHKAEMQAIADNKAKEIIDAITAYENDGSFFKNTNREELTSFTKTFFDRIVLPASSVANTRIKMNPYIDAKELGKLTSGLKGYESGETILMDVKAEGKQEITLSDRALYFSLAIDEDPKFFASGRIPIEQISILSTEEAGGNCLFKCDEYTLASFAADKVTLEDFASLKNYFKCIAEHDFEITDEEVDALIREKIGQNVLSEVKKYLVYDDEIFVYFAWGLNSLTAKDYIVCTNKQIILVDREMGGMTANIRQFYYEDITSVNTLQNTNSGDLTVDLLSNAITAATKTCDMVITVAGSSIKVSNLYKIEAERVASVYHEMKKQAKLAKEQPQQVVKEDGAIEKIQKLAQLKDAGVLTEEEFEKKKAELLTQI